MPAINFTKFIPAVKSGRKRQTIRKVRKTPIKIGDTLQLYEDCRKVGEAVCTEIQRIEINKDYVAVNGDKLSFFDAMQLSINDGFLGLWDFVAFFRDTYGLPFKGVIIKWGEIQRSE